MERFCRRVKWFFRVFCVNLVAMWTIHPRRYDLYLLQLEDLLIINRRQIRAQNVRMNNFDTRVNAIDDVLGVILDLENM